MKALGALALFLIAPLAQAAELKDMRLWDGPDATRVVFDLSANTTHSIFTLENPSRLVVDIAEVGKDGIAIANRAKGIGVVDKVRSGPRDHGVRVVFDLNGPVTPKSFMLEPNDEYGYRLMLDLEKSAPASATPNAQPAAAVTVSASAQAPAAAPATAIVVEPVTAPAPAPVVFASPAPAPVKPMPVQAVALQPVMAAAPQSSMRVQNKPIVVAIDAGHGGEDPGARGKGGLLEKTVSLALARKLAAMVNSTPGMKAVLTRDGDYYVGLRERTEVARKAEADLFVSIHANALTRREMRGTAVYVLSPRGQTNEHARWLAHKENAADMVGGIELQSKDNELAAVLIDLSQNATMEASFDVGSRILKSLGGINVLQKPVVQQAGFVVLKAPDIPSVLVETAFITNEQEERLLRTSEFQDKMAQSIFDGVRGYFSSYRPQQQIVEREPAAHAVEVSYSESGAKPAKSSKKGKGAH